MSYLRYLCLLTYSGVHHILCCVIVLFVFVLCALCCQFLCVFVLFVFVLCALCCQFLWTSFFIVPSVFSNVYLSAMLLD